MFYLIKKKIQQENLFNAESYAALSCFWARSHVAAKFCLAGSKTDMAVLEGCKFADPWDRPRESGA